MTRLYPPILEGVLPAFTDGDYLTINFSMNRAVGAKEVSDLMLKIKTVQNEVEVKTIPTAEKNFSIKNGIGTATFAVSDALQSFSRGDFLKVQLAYVDNEGEVGYYSTVGVVKFTGEPIVAISGLKGNHAINGSLPVLVGTYTQNDDPTEKVYSYRFLITDLDGVPYLDSGELIHDSTADTEINSSTDTYTLPKELEDDKTYRVIYSITTRNKLYVESEDYFLLNIPSINTDLDAILVAKNNFEDGYVELSFSPEKVDKMVGQYQIARKAEGKVWETLYTFMTSAKLTNEWTYRDFTTEQGIKYIYSIRQFNSHGVYSKRIESNIVRADFEDSFLFGGGRQLNIRFNPQVSSFKDDILEQKQDTIGSRFPYVFRNGRVKYKEFPIGGLISYMMDENSLFYDLKFDNDIEKEHNRTFDLTSDNIKSEREFKLEVLNWLNNGEPKLFRSPNEGNYLVRLMNVSLTPINSLGRMLHNFSCTAYEIAEATYTNLVNFNLIPAMGEPEDNITFKTVELLEFDKNTNIWTNHVGNILPEGTIATSMVCTGFPPNSLLTLHFEGEEDDQDIMIGMTGTYIIEYPTNIDKIEVQEPSFGTITYSYSSPYSTYFDLINKIELDSVPSMQYWGPNQDIGTDLNNAKQQVLHYGSLKFRRRLIIDVNAEIEAFKEFIRRYNLDGLGYNNFDAETDPQWNDIVNAASFEERAEAIRIYLSRFKSLSNPELIFHIYILPDGGEDQHIFYDGRNNARIGDDWIGAGFRITYADGTVADESNTRLAPTGEILLQYSDIKGLQHNSDYIDAAEYANIAGIKNIEIFDGTILEVAFLAQDVSYEFENEPEFKVMYDDMTAKLQAYIDSLSSSSDINQIQNNDAYIKYITAKTEYLFAINEKIEEAKANV